MATPFLGEIKMTSFNFAPKGWLMCNGQTLAISQYNALFALIGTFYGGNGVSTFALPNLQGAAPLHMGSPNYGGSYVMGETGGEINVTLNYNQMPSHNHTVSGVSTTAGLEAAAGNASATSAQNPYATSPNAAMNANSLTQVGGSQPHNNLPPYLVMNFVIAMQGIFPSRS
jgi:microcystin-dependent protein